MPSHSEVIPTGRPVRYEFAHALRGVAALSVVVSHFVGIFWASHKDVMDLIGLPPLARLPDLPGAVQLVVDGRLVFGMFGVGIFFVLSGFVISFSIEQESNRTFAIRRLVRIYPAYAAGFLLAMSGLWLATWTAGVPFKYTPMHLAIHTLIVLRGALGYLRIDGISWTLEIEVVFYVLMIAVGRRVLQQGVRGICIAAICIVAASAVLLLFEEMAFVGVQVSCGLMLLCGLAYAQHVQQRLSTPQLVVTQLGLAAVLALVWLLINRRTALPLQWLGGYLIGLAVFAMCYAHWRHRPVPSRILNHMADVSYPLYIVHALLGYAVMRYVILQTGSAALAVATAFVTTYGLATLLHLMIEQPFVAWSRALTTRVGRPKPAVTSSTEPLSG